jgi:hypothetical protein
MSKFKKKKVVTSRLKAYQQYIDNFEGVVLKSAWKPYRGSWVLGTGAAVSSSDPSSYAISGVKLSLPNLTASASISGGTGLAYWVSDANSWVASVSTNTTSSTSTCNAGLVTNQSNPPSGSCCSGVTTIPGSSAFSYTAQWNPPSSYTYGASFQNAYSYTYSASFQGGYSYSYNATLSPSYSYTYAASVTNTAQTRCCGATNISKDYNERINYIPKCWLCDGPCTETYSFSQCCPSGTTKSGSTCYYPATTSYSCPSGGSLSGTTCTVSVTGGYSCPSGGSLSGSQCIVSVAGGYTCPSGGSLSGTTCTVQVAGSYYCPSGGSLSGTTCTVSVSGFYSCPSGGNLSGTTCNVPAGANQYSCYTQTTTSTSYNYYLRVIKSIGGVVSSVGTDVALPSQPLAIKVAISGTSVQSTAYSTVSMSTSIGTRSDTITSPSPTGVVGIIKSPSQYLQGSTVANFSATI